LKQKIYLILYYFLASKLPRCETPIVGLSFRKLRRFLTERIFKQAGNNININTGVYFGNGNNIQIGNNSSMEVGCQIANDTIIGNDVMIAPDVIIFSQGHETTNVNTLMRLQGKTPPRPVVIGNDVWIGQRAIILPGVTIQDGAIIGAGSIVTKDVAARTVVGGNPAKFIKNRDG